MDAYDMFWIICEKFFSLATYVTSTAFEPPFLNMLSTSAGSSILCTIYWSISDKPDSLDKLLMS